MTPTDNLFEPIGGYGPYGDGAPGGFRRLEPKPVPVKRTLVLLALVLACLAPATGVRAAPSCVGNPPRQTEDPLSPPCVPFFIGDNGGSTYTGVTKDEVRVVLYNDLGVDTDLNEPWHPYEDTVGPPDTSLITLTLKRQLEYHLAHYQTYQRTVHVIARSSAQGSDTSCVLRRRDAVAIRELAPFAVIAFGDHMDCFADQVSVSFKIPVFMASSDVSGALLDSHRPYIWSFAPQAETESATSASFLCRSLSGNARLARDPSLATAPRSFGLIRPSTPLPVLSRLLETDTTLFDLSELLIADAARACGMTFATIDAYIGEGDADALMAAYKSKGITTVVCYCDARANIPRAMQAAATHAGYFPEWYWDHASRMDRSYLTRDNADPTQASFGVTASWRLPAYEDQYATRAFYEMEGFFWPNLRHNAEIYHAFLNLFYAIQGAGPNLTPETVQRGLFTFSFTDGDNLFEPIGGYGPYGDGAPGDYSFIDTAMAWLWDPADAEPGRDAGGCMRVANDGRRYGAGAWPLGDAWLDAGAPCTASPAF